MIVSKKLFLKYDKAMSGTWYEKNGNKEVQIETQGKLNKYPEEIIDKAIDNPGEWIEFEINNKQDDKKKLKNDIKEKEMLIEQLKKDGNEGGIEEVNFELEKLYEKLNNLEGNMKEQIRKLVVEGKTDEEIKKILSGEKNQASIKAEDESLHSQKLVLLDTFDSMKIPMTMEDLEPITKMEQDDEKGIMTTTFSDGSQIVEEYESWQNEENVKKFVDKLKSLKASVKANLSTYDIGKYLNKIKNAINDSLADVVSEFDKEDYNDIEWIEQLSNMVKKAVLGKFGIKASIKASLSKSANKTYEQLNTFLEDIEKEKVGATAEKLKALDDLHTMVYNVIKPIKENIELKDLTVEDLEEKEAGKKDDESVH